jgi:hypothetical protein
MKIAEGVGEHPRLQQSLRRVVAAAEERVAREGEDHRVGVERAEPAERRDRQSEIEGGIGELQGDQQPHNHSDQAPDEAGNEKLADDGIIVREFVQHRSRSCTRHSCTHTRASRPRD